MWSGTLDNEDPVAIKVAKPKTTGKTVLQSFINEVIMLRYKKSHPLTFQKQNLQPNTLFLIQSKCNQEGNSHIISFIGLCKTPKICILTELMECSLYDLLHKRKERFELRKTVSMANDIASGLAYLHNKCKILHNDITSKNILYSPVERKGSFDESKDYILKIADLGLASFVQKKSEFHKEDNPNKNFPSTFSGFTAFNAPIGNARWRSPEGTKTNQTTEK